MLNLTQRRVSGKIEKMDDQLKQQQERTATSKWALLKSAFRSSFFSHRDQQAHLPPDPIPPPDAEALSRPQFPPREEEIQAEPRESITEEKMKSQENESSLQAQSQERQKSLWRVVKAVFNMLSLYWKRKSSSEPAPDGQKQTPEEKREEKTEETHPEWTKMDERLEKILEEESTRLLNREFNQLTELEKKCLVCFSVFEPDSKIKKQIMIYWWIGEYLADSPQDTTAEEEGEKCFRRLAELGFIEPIGNTCTSTIHECRVQPFVHWMVKKKAREASFCDLDKRGKPSAELPKPPSPCLCLTSETKPYLSSSDSSSSLAAQKTEKLQVMFNVSKQSYRSQFDDLLMNFKNIVVLQLGRWSSDAKYHIEVEGFENFKNIGLLTNLRYLGLQGLSRLTTLPPQIKKLKHLLILDLRGCQYLEKVGTDATYLKRLTHLDLTECYMLEHIASGFGSLSELQVFKGFVFGGGSRGGKCRLADLSKLKKLRKLSINITSEANIEDNEMNLLEKFSSVRSLTITWGEIPTSGDSKPTTGETPTSGDSKDDSISKKRKALKLPPCIEKFDMRWFPYSKPTTGETPTIGDSKDDFISKKWKALKLPPSIEKFDMRCFPYAEMPNWLEGAQNLQRLYIRGGKLQTLHPENGLSETGIRYLSIKRLRLKYLKDFDMEWSKIREMMPYLDRLEYVKCEKPPPNSDKEPKEPKEPKELKSPPPLDQNHIWIRDKEDEERKSDRIPPVAPSPAIPDDASTSTAVLSSDAKPALQGFPTKEASTEAVGAPKENITPETAPDETAMGDDATEVAAASDEEIATKPGKGTSEPDFPVSPTNEATAGTAAASEEETTAEPALHQSPTNEAAAETVAASKEEEEEEEEEEEAAATAETAAASKEETTTKPDLHGSPTNEATTKTFAASKEENITETTHRQTPTDETSPKSVDEIITAEPALQDLSAASTSAVANPTNNSSTNATTEAPSNPSVVPATSSGASIGDEEGNA